MTEKLIYIPFPKELYDDLIRFSDGGMDVSVWLEDQLMDFFERNLGAATSELFGARSTEFYRKYFPDYAKEVEENLRRAEELDLVELIEKPLVWKEITINSGTKVRMQYGGTHHFAVVRDGKIQDRSGSYSPSQWARKVANDTSRNAWRDIEFKDSGSTHWRLAEILRDKVRSQLEGHDSAEN